SSGTKSHPTPSGTGHPAGGPGTRPSPRSHPPKPAPPAHLPLPANVRPLVANPLPHEGTWQPVGPKVHGLPTGEVAFLRPDTVHTSLVAGLLWMDTKLVRAALFAGTQEPGGSGWYRYAEVPTVTRSHLAFTFNSGFRMNDARGGWYSQGRTAVPLV